jgi:hypothetical protein
MMQREKCDEILYLMEGENAGDGCAIIAQALIHICMQVEVTKEEMLRSITAQWDAYAQFCRDKAMH